MQGTEQLTDYNAAPELMEKMVRRFMDGEFGPVK
jgi:hypothetical protein